MVLNPHGLNVSLTKSVIKIFIIEFDINLQRKKLFKYNPVYDQLILLGFQLALICKSKANIQIKSNSYKLTYEDKINLCKQSIFTAFPMMTKLNMTFFLLKEIKANLINNIK